MTFIYVVVLLAAITAEATHHWTTSLCFAFIAFVIYLCAQSSRRSKPHCLSRSQR